MFGVKIMLIGIMIMINGNRELYMYEDDYQKGGKHNDVGREFTFSNCRSPVQDALPPPRAQIACSSSAGFAEQLYV